MQNVETEIKIFQVPRHIHHKGSLLMLSFIISSLAEPQVATYLVIDLA